jgi:hypothetical protein
LLRAVRWRSCPDAGVRGLGSQWVARRRYRRRGSGRRRLRRTWHCWVVRRCVPVRASARSARSRAFSCSRAATSWARRSLQVTAVRQPFSSFGLVGLRLCNECAFTSLSLRNGVVVVMMRGAWSRAVASGLYAREVLNRRHAGRAGFFVLLVPLSCRSRPARLPRLVSGCGTERAAPVSVPEGSPWSWMTGNCRCPAQC